MSETDITILARPAEIVHELHAPDIPLIREEMRARGHDASDLDIEWAYSEWCDRNYCASWLVIDSPMVGTYANAALIVIGMLKKAGEA
jgi:hypothetical protein